MAMDLIPGVGGSGVTKTGDAPKRGRTAATAETSGGRAGRSPAANRHVIDIDGRSFDRRAPRGTYLDILV